MKKHLVKFGLLLAGLTLAYTVYSQNTTCLMFLHQLKLPDAAKNLRKF